MVGSLEILGNPAGLVRSFGTGVSDLVRLPLAGLRNGPGAFLAGFTTGMGSLLKNVTTGIYTYIIINSVISKNFPRSNWD